MSPKNRMPDDTLSERFKHGLNWKIVDGERRPVYAVGPYEIDLVSAEDAPFRLVADAYEALRLDEDNPVPRGRTYEVQRGYLRG
ncbi:hypothetical protein [Streptomyces sp. SLBN-134]|uniref:hypothetical protein n=1 Tax=Streptomyces sp. SLBN-134 TaxID=2768456 RepID=UPI001153D773|nr:hypothetical protein [Streptomyces sp. SLBN-134]TQL19468.1 hypothetical protein FBY37_1387 [Streptomyces sp. SLBN-134]